MNDHEWSPPHSHDPNPTPPTDDATIVLSKSGNENHLTPEDLNAMPQQSVPGCFIISTGHGTSGPFTFSGVPLLHLLERYGGRKWSTADVISADGFRARVTSDELRTATTRPILLATTIDGRALTREEGLVRLVVPGETGDALRQVKWVSKIRLL